MTKHLRTLRGKVIALTLLLVLSTQLATVLFVLFAANNDIDQRATDDLQDSSVVLQKLIQNRSTVLQRIVEPLSTDPGFVANVDNGNTDAIISELDKRAQWIGADIALVADINGQTLATTGEIIPRNTDVSLLSVRNHVTIELGQSFYEVTSAPMANGGRVALGFRIDESLAQMFASISGMEITLVARNQDGMVRILGSSLTDDAQQMVLSTARRVADGLQHQDGVNAMRSDFLSMRIPFLGDEAPVEPNMVSAIVQEPIDKAMAAFDSLVAAMLHAALFSIACAFLMSIYLSRNLTRPVRRLLLAARRMRIGNYTRKLHITSTDEFGELGRAFESMRTGIAEREQRITFQAQFDDLTGLPNRNQGMELLRNNLRVSSKTGNPLAIMVMHLQRFREIQSSLGHEIGDEVLRQVAARMSQILDDNQTLARLEGDQFMILAPNKDRFEAKGLAQELSDIMDHGMTVQSVNVTLDACIGICISPEHGRQPDDLLRRAAVAKNDAQQSQNRVRVYQNGREARHVRQLAILGDLRRATQENELELFLQPKIALRDTKVCGAEALLRWEHPELGQIPPYEFVPLAEHAGNIACVTEWVINRAVEQCATWKKLEIDLPIAINLSRRDLLNRHLPDLIQEQLDGHGVDPESLILEITEEAVMQDLDRAVKVLERLREMGLSISMDDFGTGYSSLGHLQNLPVDELKIDRSFVTNLPDDRETAAIVRSIIDLAHNLALEVVAEGVETTAALRWLREEGCERAQGYYLSKPMPARDFEIWLYEWERLGNTENERIDPGESLILRPRLIT